MRILLLLESVLDNFQTQKKDPALTRQEQF
jgi:hypothetical protein